MDTSHTRRSRLENLRRSLVMAQPDEPCRLTNQQTARLCGCLIEALEEIDRREWRKFI
jgi:hypothetical protein